MLDLIFHEDIESYVIEISIFLTRLLHENKFGNLYIYIYNNSKTISILYLFVHIQIRDSSRYRYISFLLYLK